MRRRQILEQAQALYAELGDAGLRMRDLAERCGYTAGALYIYFRDRDALLDALREQALDVLSQEMKALRNRVGGRRGQVPEKPEWLALFVDMSRHWWRVLMAQPHRRALLLRAPQAIGKNISAFDEPPVLTQLMSVLAPAEWALEQAGWRAEDARSVQVNLLLWAIGQCVTVVSPPTEQALASAEERFVGFLEFCVGSQSPQLAGEAPGLTSRSAAEASAQAQSDLFG